MTSPSKSPSAILTRWIDIARETAPKDKGKIYRAFWILRDVIDGTVKIKKQDALEALDILRGCRSTPDRKTIEDAVLKKLEGEKPTQYEIF